MVRSFLFVPGDRPERFDKAVASGADAVCIDLEDAVSALNKLAARRAALAYLSDKAPRATAVGIRLNALDRIDGIRDVAALADSCATPAFLLLPKVRSRDVIDQVREIFGDAAPPIWALMETPEAVAGIAVIAAGVRQGGGIVFGGADLSAALGSDMSWDALYFARAALISGAAPVGCQLVDVPYLDVRDIAGMVDETRRIKAMGFTGRACIHPDQVKPINAAFSPTANEIEGARAVIDAYEKNGGRVLLVEGRLVEKPIWAAARRILARAKP